MGNNNIKGTNEILIKVDQNNLIYIDPNSELTSDGVIQARSVEPENLVMYANLEADLVPRTTLIADGDQNTLSSIAGGTLNFMRNDKGRDYDTKWTDAYTEVDSSSFNFNSSGSFATLAKGETPKGGSHDATGQSFGITDISIDIEGANFIPRIVINFIDVRGKTLFESPENSPYAAFFHLPWPIFYLTIKGFYGKAIKYRLHLVKFNTRFDPGTGNMMVETNFVGSTYAYLADISLESVLNAPYFYISENSQEGNTNEDKGTTEISVSKTTKGYRVLKSVYQEYVSKGLLPSDFPVRTLRELITIANRLNQTLEKEIFSSVVDPKILAGVKEYEDLMSNFEGSILAWKSKYVSPEYFLTEETRADGEKIRWFKLTGDEKNTLNKVTNPRNEGTLERILDVHITRLNENLTFGNKRDKKLIKADDLTITPVSLVPLTNIDDYYTIATTVGIDMDGLQDALYTVYRNFIEQRNKLESDIELRMNEIVKDKSNGIGFEPTIRNIIGVVLANADTYVRLMKDVHDKAFESANVRKKILSGVDTDSDNPAECIYPWPAVRTKSAGGKERLLMYPGSRELLGKLQSNNKNLWPEVEYIENFYDIATKKLDPLSTLGDGAVEFVFATQGSTEKIDLSTLTNVLGNIPYDNKSFSSVIYEIYERAKYTTSLSSFDEKSIIELANVEFENIKEQLAEDVDVIDLLQQNIKTPNDLLGYMQSLSTYERFPYYEDQLPTTWYLKEGLSQDYKVEKATQTENTRDYNSSYENLSNFLLNYIPEDYRTKIYPFNSSTYETYLDKDFTPKLLNPNGLLKVSTPNDFISSPIDATMWVKDGYTDNLFDYTLDIDGTSKHILNTPYFHKQLFNDFNVGTGSTREKYVGSAYLLLNSLPFKDLDDTVQYTTKAADGTTTSEETLMSTLFREIGSSHYVPYHMMLKWGSIYHRYKKGIDGDDILDFGTTDLRYDPISGSTFFDNNSGMTYNSMSQSGIGFHPYYETVFHQISNGYLFFNPTVPGAYEDSISNGVTYLSEGTPTGAKAYTSFVDNTKFGYSGYTLLPTNGNNDTYGTDILKAEQENFRLLWNVGVDDTDIINYSGYTFPGYTGHTKNVTTGDYMLISGYSLTENYRKVVDLIATFKPDILDIFEQAFIDFSNERVDEEITYKPYEVPYSSFQDLLESIVTVEKSNSDTTTAIGLIKLMKDIKTRQTTALTTITNTILSPSTLIKVVMANPREIDNYVLGGFTGINVQNFSTDSYLSDPNFFNNALLPLGEDMDGYYEDFFEMMDIDPSEDNMKQFRQIIYIYAGLRADGISHNKSGFVQYLIDNLIEPIFTDSDGKSTLKNNATGVAGQDTRLYTFLKQLIPLFQKIVIPTTADNATKQRGYNDDPLKLELYNYFKSFNDKWTAGNSIGQRTLLEEFLFIDKANRDIGNDLFIDMQKLTRLGEEGNSKINLFSVISLLVQDSGIDIRALPAYVNFYGNDFTNKAKVMPSRTIAQTMFGSFLEVDTQDSGPKIILQYTGPTSKHPDISDINKKYKFKNDGFDISDVNNNPIIVGPDVFTKTDFTKENKVVAFEVSFGDQNQSIFKGVELDQATLRNTSESFEVLERLGRNETGSSTSQIDIGLFNIYRQSSYQCKVTCMGDMMIQPTMYFYVKNIPLFKGSYLITEVHHSITTSGAQTTFQGTRIPKESLPDPADSFLASYRPLFDRIIKKARAKIAAETAAALSGNTGTAITVVDGRGNAYTTDPGGVIFNGETIVNGAGFTDYGIPYNGKTEDKTIQMIEYDRSLPSEHGGNVWLRGVAVRMGGDNYDIDKKTVMNIASGLKTGHDGEPKKVYWRDLVKNEGEWYFYSSKFDGTQVSPDTIIHTYKRTEFLNPRVINDQSLIGKRYYKIVEVDNFIDFKDDVYQGPVNVGPSSNDYGIGLSGKLMSELGLEDGDVVYFRMSK